MKSRDRIRADTLFVGIAIVFVAVLAWSFQLAQSDQHRPAPTAYSVRFLNVKNGETLSGDIPLTVILSTYVDEDAVKLTQNGVDMGVGDWEDHVPGGSAGQITFGLFTTEYPNGVYRLTVVDRYGKGQSISVKFKNTVESFSIDPVGGNVGCPIYANLGKLQSWTVQVRRFTGDESVITVFKGKSRIVNLTWDGTDGHGRHVSDAYIELFAGDQYLEKECHMRHTEYPS
ncbi:MAG: hypothetical protein ACLQVD_00755 [Capsulimonadaceae bacterium]